MTPLIVQTASLADFSIQTFVTPQYVLQKPITFDNPNQFNVPPPQRVSHYDHNKFFDKFKHTAETMHSR